MSPRVERTAVASLLAVFFGLSLTSVLNKTLTADEPFHYRYGRQILGLDAVRFDNSKMPLSAWNAIPCRLGEALGGAFDGGGDGLGRLLCHRTTARLMTSLVALILGIYVHRWSRLLYGPAAGLLSLALFAFSPNLIAHGRLVTTDLYAATAATVAAYHFWRFVELGGGRRGLASAATLGAAQLAKYSMVWLYPIFLATLAVRAAVVARVGGVNRVPTFGDWSAWARVTAGFLLVSALTINVGFLWHRVFVPLDEYAFKTDLFQSLQRFAGPAGRIPVPLAYPYLEGLDWVKESDEYGTTAGNVYLLGEVRDKRDPNRAFPGYFFIASLFKVPLATQILFAWSLVILLRRFNARDFVRRELYLVMPCVVYGIYFNFFLKSPLGIRLFMIVFPFALVLCGRVLAEPPSARSRLAAVSGLAVWTVASVLSYFPHYLSYFNELVWDRKMAYKVLADSNLAWGQDTLYLREYVREHPDVVVRPRQPMAGRLVVDVNRLTGVFQRRRLAWLRDNFEPVDRIAGSYLVFDVTPEALERALANGGQTVSRWMALGLAYLVTRLYQLTLLPLFVDEAVHLRWTVRLVEEGRLDRILVDGKLLNVVLMSATVPWVSNPAWWGRATTVAVGAVGLWTTQRIAVRLFGERVGWVAAFLYVICPFALFYDRMALADAYLSSFAALVLYSSFAFQSDPSRKNGLWLGLGMAACVLSKIPGLLTLGLPPLVLLLLGRPKGWVRGLGVAYGVFVALAAPFVAHFFSRTGQLGMKASIPEGGKGRLASIAYNLGLVWEWLTIYWGPTLLVVVAATCVLALRRWRRPELVLLVACMAPITLFVFVSFHWFPRYVLLSTVPFLILGARGLCHGYDWMAERLERPAIRRVAAVALAGLVAWPAVRVVQPLFVDPVAAPLPTVERFQYVDGWPSGYAWIDAAETLRERARKSEIGVRVLVERADHRVALAVLWGYLMNDSRLEILPVDLRRQEFRHLLVRSMHERETYVLASGARPDKVEPIPEGNGYELELTESFRKPDGRLVGKLFKALPPVVRVRTGPS